MEGAAQYLLKDELESKPVIDLFTCPLTVRLRGPGVRTVKLKN
jgi:hypothetical protein